MNLIKMNKDLIPSVMISIHIQNLQVNGLTLKGLSKVISGKGILSKQFELQCANIVQNLYLTYGIDFVRETIRELFLNSLKKVG